MSRAGLAALLAAILVVGGLVVREIADSPDRGDDRDEEVLGQVQRPEDEPVEAGGRSPVDARREVGSEETDGSAVATGARDASEPATEDVGADDDGATGAATDKDTDADVSVELPAGFFDFLFEVTAVPAAPTATRPAPLPPPTPTPVVVPPGSTAIVGSPVQFGPPAGRIEPSASVRVLELRYDGLAADVTIEIQGVGVSEVQCASIDWGDADSHIGCGLACTAADVVPSGLLSDIRNLGHTYPAPGRYELRIEAIVTTPGAPCHSTIAVTTTATVIVG